MEEEATHLLSLCLDSLPPLDYGGAMLANIEEAYNDAGGFLSDLSLVEFAASDAVKRVLLWVYAVIKYHDIAYYQKGAPIIVDSKYDEILALFRVLNAEAGGVIDEWVGVDPESHFRRVEHISPMLSLDNIFGMSGVDKFLAKLHRLSGYELSKDFPLVAELKIDGVSFSAVYKDGFFIRGVTRGNGHVGEDVTENIAVLEDFPHFLPSVTGTIEVRGEVYMPISEFKSLKDSGSLTLSNPRSAAVGSIRHLDAKITASRNLRYFAYSLFGCNCGSQFEALERLKSWGFKVNEHSEKLDSRGDIDGFYDNILQHVRPFLDYETDGLVYKVNDLSLQAKLGYTSHAPRWAVAHKFPAERAETVLKKITVQVGRLGTLTPVAELQPCNIGGVTVRRSGLYNRAEIERLGVREGDTVLVERAGSVIPRIIGVVKSKRRKDSSAFEFPKECPVCHSQLVALDGGAIIRCSGSFFCESQAVERLKHFVSSDAFDIVGVGEKQITYFRTAGILNDPVDLFRLKQILADRDLHLYNMKGWGLRSSQRLFDSIEQAREIPINRFIFSFGIPNVGKVTSELLMRHYEDVDHWLQDMELLASTGSCQLSDLEVPGIGPFVIDSLKSFFQNQQNRYLVHELLGFVKVTDCHLGAAELQDSPVKGKLIAFTGSLSRMTRREAEIKATWLGAKVTRSLSSNTDYLIVGFDSGSKYEKALGLGVSILSEEQWYKMVGEEL